MTPQTNAARPRITPQVFIGLIVITLGVLFTLDNLGILDAVVYLRYWPVILVIIGAVKIWNARRDGHGWFGGLIFLGIGSYMLVNRIAYFEIDARMLFPLFLVFLGGYMVWRGFSRNASREKAADGLSRFSSLSIMGGSSRRSNSQAFEGADLTAVMGGCEVDLREASIAPNNEAIIDVFAFWGGIDLKVPEDWVVINRVIPLMGGVDDKTRTPVAGSTPAKRLIIRGIVLMGGVSIKNRSRRDDARDMVSTASAVRQELRNAGREIREQIRNNREY
jgi:predicted membrane protein